MRKIKLDKAKAEMTSNIRNDKERRESRKRSLTNDLNDAKTQLQKAKYKLELLVNKDYDTDG